jgi:hypothetical protein
MEAVGRLPVVGQVIDQVLELQEGPRVHLEGQVEVERATAALLGVKVDLPGLPQRVGLHEVALVVDVEAVLDGVVLQLGDVAGDVEGGHAPRVEAGPTENCRAPGSVGCSTGSMEGYGAATYGDRIAAVYDDWHGGRPDTDACVARLAELAGDGPVLELAVGTGRVALPLVRQGVEVHGIDASEAMVAELLAKPDGDRVRVTMGDFADVDVPGRFPLVFLVFSTLFGLPSQEEQVRCFANVATRLAEGGRFVVEAFVPDLTRFHRDQAVTVAHVGLDDVRIDVSRHDPTHQRIESQHVWLGPSGTRLSPVSLRYAWPPEIDLMAAVAGLRLEDRWGGWRRDPFTAASTNHVSVYAAG